MPILKIKHLDKTEEFKLKAKAKIVIGRNKDCDIILPYKYISRRHCTVILMFADTHFYWVLKDGLLQLKRDYKTQSTNGTYVNNKVVKELIPLVNNDVITFSQSKLYPNIVFMDCVAEVGDDLDDCTHTEDDDLPT